MFFSLFSISAEKCNVHADEIGLNGVLESLFTAITDQLTFVMSL